MVLLVAKINKLYSKLENNLHHSNEAVLSASLEGFFSDVFNDLNCKLSSSSSETMSFSSIQTLFDLIPFTNKAFAKLVMEIDHPMSKWKPDSADRYLNYTLTLLNLFNSVSFSLSHLCQSRLSLSHGLSLKEEKKSPSSVSRHLKRIEPFELVDKDKDVFVGERRLGEQVTKGSFSNCASKDEAVRRALLVMESLGFWVCGVALKSLSGDGFVLESAVARLESSVFEAMLVEKKVEIVKEVRDVNESVERLVASIGDEAENEELRKRLSVFERELDGFGNEVDRLFVELLRRRNQLLSGLQEHERKE